MRSVSFDYPNTCPRIDKEIDNAKHIIQKTMESVLEQACPFMSRNDVLARASDFAEDLYSDLEDCFEVVRTTNREIRDSAEQQIDNLAEEIKNLEYEIDAMRSSNE